MANISVPNTFVNNTQIADATEVNANFGAITTGLAAGNYDSYWANTNIKSSLIASGLAHFYSSVSFAGSSTFDASTYYNHNSQFNSSVSLPTATLVSLGTDTGVLKLAAGVASVASIVNADISASAAIAYSKLNLSGSIVNADISTSAAIAYSKLNLATSIVNADISASAAIAGSKISPDFGSQNIVTTGTISAGTATFGAVGSTATHTVRGGILDVICTGANPPVIRVQNTDTTIEGDQVYGTYGWYSNDATNPGLAAKIVAVSPSGNTNGCTNLKFYTTKNGGTVGDNLAFQIGNDGGSADQCIFGASGSTSVHQFNAASQTTVGAAGGASALPATPTGYLEMNINGTARVIPYYAKS